MIGWVGGGRLQRKELTKKNGCRILSVKTLSLFTICYFDCAKYLFHFGGGN